MALAAQPHLHNFPPQSKSHEPSWDEAIVPALRQRLQNESQMLTKRLSTHGISAAAAAEQANASVQSSSQSQSKPSAIPRPSSEGPAKKRQRTNSTPHSAIPIPVATTRIPKAAATASSTTTKTGSISSHGHQQPHSYRPSNLSNSVTGSISGSVSRGTGGSGNSNKRPRLDYSTMEPPSPSSFDSSSRAPRHGFPNGISVAASKSYIPNEEAPFPNSASTSTEFHYEQTRLMHAAATRNAHGRYATTGSSSFDADSGRPSMDEAGAYAAEEEEYRAMISARAAKRESAERPFEHWYRGEAARNGGVGELKIGKSEMLDIAQFGYARGAGAADKPGGATIGPGSTFSATAALRRRAGSFDGKRESWIIPPEMVDINGAYGSKVIDESPLTDLEGDEYTTEGERNYPYPGTNNSASAAAAEYPYATRGIINGASTTAVGGPGSSRPDDGDDDNAYEEDTTMVLSTTPTGISSIPTGRRGTVTNAIPRATAIPNGRQASGKTPLGTSNGANTAPPAAAGPSSAAAPPSKAALLGKPAGKNSKNKAGKQATKQRSRTFGSADQPPEIAALQQEEEIDVEKIPFRKPPAKGNWDDIVLPAVTKKMGIEGYGLKSEEGNILEISEEVRKRMSVINPPAPVPGLFGYDLSKYRPPRPEEDIQMGELGVSEPSPPGTPKANTPAALPPPNTGRDSPLAFSHYQDNLPPLTEKDAKRKSKRASAGVPAIMVSPPSAEEHARRRKEMEAEAEKGASKGCCGCVIM